LRLDLYARERDRREADAPVKDAGRPGLALLTSQGKAYERAKFLELETVFPDLVVRGDLKDFDAAEDRAFHSIRLADHIDTLGENQLALEGEYEITPPFVVAHQLGSLADGSAVADGASLEFEGARPDIIQVRPAAGVPRRIIAPSGYLEVIPAGDGRLGLKIIDIKISGEPSPAHFSELAYYGMVLACWLKHHRKADKFVVLAEAAIWPGSHEGSTIQRFDREDRANNVPQRDLARYLGGFDADLEAMPPEVVLGRVRRFLTVDLREVLAVASWRDLPWHIDLRCAGCDYLGYRWSRHDNEAAETAPPQGKEPDQRYCWPTAEQQGHLSRVTGLTEGAAGKLREAAVLNVIAVSTLQAGSPIFEQHQTLRARRTVLRERAVSLTQQIAAHIPDRAGTSAVLPRFADIRVGVSTDFDVGSGLTFAVGYRIDYGVPNAFRPRGPDGPRFGRAFRLVERPLLVLERSLEAEGDIFRLWLEHLVDDVHRCQAEVLNGYRQNGAPDKADVTLQFFIWDRLTLEHLRRVMGRHLESLHIPVRVGGRDITPMAWLFPAESVLEEPDFVSRSSPITVLSDTVNSLIAAPLPHHYGIIDLANSIEPEGRILANGQPWSFHVNKFYRDPLSDQIPSERGHEIWERGSPFRDRDFQWHQDTTRAVVRRKLQAVSYVAEKLTRLLGTTLTSEAPTVGSVFQPADRLAGVGDDGQIIYQHAKLMASAERLEIDLLMAMPPHEREARFRSARIDHVLGTTERLRALRNLDLANRAGDAEVLAFRLSERSKEARIKEGEYTWSFLPEADLPALQELTVAQFKTRNLTLERRNPTQPWEYRRKLRDELKVTILRIDRGARLLVAEAGSLLRDVLALQLLQMDIDGARGRFAVLDPVAMDVFTGKVRRSLADPTGIRNPPLAQNRPLFPNPRVARVRAGRPRAGAVNPPAADFIWNADAVAAQATGQDSNAVLTAATSTDPALTPRQRDAIRQSTERRLALWWGPPGTGKSRTAQAYITAMACVHAAANTPLRVAIIGFTWIAIDNVARRLPALLQSQGILDRVAMYRLSSTDAGLGSVDPLLRAYVLSMDDAATTDRIELERRLSEQDGITVVASTVDQLFKLGDPQRCAPLFDVLLIDEASQLDVAHAIVALTKLAAGGQVTVVGDDKQMAPIHPIESPEGIEHLLGSVYDFYRKYRIHEGPRFAIEPTMLNRSFRSNREIIEFVREAGYGDDLEAAPGNQGLRIGLSRALPAAVPANWPADLPWSAHYGSILDPNQPLAAIVHSDRFSSQRNDGEADLVAGLVLTLFQAGLANLEVDNRNPYGPEGFFRQGLGIVTPHRAQQAAVFDRLARMMPEGISRNDIFASIDTVERFQGQERALMIASFGLGDADQIAAEEQFLFSLNRFNVAASRARAKFIAIVSRQLVDHLPRDPRTLQESRLLKHFIDGFLTNGRAIELAGLGRCELRTR
jgi:DNA replication ATP-dependent helicase Dna2